MNQQTCNRPWLDAFLKNDLNAREEQMLTSHLDECSDCREELESRAAEQSVWREASNLLGGNTLLSTAAIGDSRFGTVHSPQIALVLQQLAPTDDPESLGRIGGYEVTGVVGAGGMGVVLKAHDRSLDRIVAIKVMSPHLASSGSARKRFAREAKAAAAVLHPNVIAIHSVASEEVCPFLVMPYVRGASLQKRIDSQGPLPLKDTLRIGAQIAAGLAAAHEQGLVHRDIKPANILLEEGVERVTITDFGLARAVDDASMTCSGVIAGTPQYMSPEQARGEPIDARSDLFSLGGVLYAMCTGRSPFRAETTYGVLHRIANDKPTPVCEVNTDVPVWLGHVIERLMAKRPEDRFESAAQVAELLEGCLAHVQQPAAMPLPEAVTALAPIKTRRPPIGKLIVAAAFVLAFIFAGVFVVLDLNKGTLTIQSDVDDIRVRITRGEDVVNELKVTKSGQSVRIASGQYQVEIIGETDGLTVENGQVTLHRADTEVVKIVHNGNNANPPTDKNPNEIWSADSAGTWPMPGGVTLEVKRELFHGADVATSAVLTWPEDATGTAHAFSSSVASDAFGNREPWHVAWERNSPSFWTIRGNLGDHGPGLAKLFCVNRINFADKSKIVTTTWYHRPDEMPKGIQLAFEKVFEPLPTTPRRASEAEGSTRVEQAHDVRPIEELLHGVWKSSSSEPRVQMTFPEQDTGDVQWTIDYGKGTPAIDAKIAMIRVPANNAIRLWIRPSQLPNVDERDVIGTIRRGPDSTLLLDITGSPKFPDYKKVLGIVLSTARVPGTEVPDDKVESTGQDASKASTGETLEVSLAPKSVDQKTSRASAARALNDQVIDALVTFEFNGVSGNATLNTSGIGWVVDQRGHILVPSEAAPRSEDYSIEVRYADGSRTSAKRVFTFGHLALLKPEKAPAIAPIKLNSKQAVQDGDQVLAILNGTDVQKGTVTSARKTIVSLDSWPILYSPRLRFPNAIETDFKSDPATLFGAPMLTPSGEVVGMLLNYAPPMFAIPLSEIQIACREFEASHTQSPVNSAEATLAAEEAGVEHSKTVPGNIDSERATNAVKRVMQYLMAVKEKDSETIDLVAKGLAKNANREIEIAKLVTGGDIPKHYKTWFLNHSAVVALGPLSSSDKQMNGRFLLFTLSLVDERWSIVDIDLEVEEKLLERFKNPIQAVDGTPETANSKSNVNEKNTTKSSPEYPPVKIVVHDEEGKPLEGVKVSLYQLAKTEGGQVLEINEISNASGMAVNRNLPYGHYELSARTSDGWYLPGYRSRLNVEFEKGVDVILVAPTPGKTSKLVISSDIMTSPEKISGLRFGGLTEGNRTDHAPEPEGSDSFKEKEFSSFPTITNGIEYVGAEIRLEIWRSISQPAPSMQQMNARWYWSRPPNSKVSIRYLIANGQARSFDEGNTPLNETLKRLTVEGSGFFKLPRPNYRVGAELLKLREPTQLPLELDIPAGDVRVKIGRFLGKPNAAVMAALNWQPKEQQPELWLQAYLAPDSAWVERLINVDWINSPFRSGGSVGFTSLWRDQALQPDERLEIPLGMKQTPAPPPLGKILQQLQGKWRVSRQIDHDGSKRSMSSQTVWEFKGDRYVAGYSGPAGLIEVDDSQSPVHVKWTILNDRRSGLGLLSIEGDKAVFCMGKPQEAPDPSSRPEKLQWVAGAFYMELTRMKPGDTVAPLKPEFESPMPTSSPIEAVTQNSTIAAESNAPAIDHRNARSVVEAYVASALAGDIAKAASLAKNSPADPKHIRELPETLNIQRLKIETVYVNDPAKPAQAMATSVAVKLEEEHKNPDGRRDGFMVFTLELTDEKWFVIDIDFETESGAEKELNKFLKANPGSIGIPPQSESLSR